MVIDYLFSSQDVQLCTVPSLPIKNSSRAFWYSQYFPLTQDMGSDYMGDEAIRAQYAISSAEFAEWLNAIPARKQVMMIDACASGQFNEDMALLAMNNISGSQIRALDRLRDRTGIYITSGSANDQASYEASPYGMGLLTYSLLTGMSGGALREDEYMDVEGLFSFAEEQVPVLAEDVAEPPWRFRLGIVSLSIWIFLAGMR